MPMIRSSFIFVLYFSLGSCRQCDSSDYEFKYTACDVSGSRWRVAVPRSNYNCEGGLPEPQRGLNCSFSCSPGNYLDLDTQRCRPCRAGQYSLGGGIRYEEFTTLPAGFSIENFDADSDQFIDTSSRSTMPCPPEAGWVIRNEELLYIPTPCISRLSFSASLVRAGFAEYSYHMPRNNRALSLQVDVRNQQCQSYRESMQSMMNRYTKKEKTHKEESSNDWQRRRIELRSGLNVISWTVSNSAGMKVSSEPIRIARIDILGLAFIQECSPCPAGTYSDIGSAECIACAAGFHSSKGAGKCERCPESQFSGPKSAICVNRPPCRQSDFYPVTESCNNGSTRTIYKKVQPEVCRVDLPGAADLPPPGPWRSCPTCNPGMEKDQHGVCVFCEKEHFSDGNGCSRCPVYTIPNYGYQYVQWESLPPNIGTRCDFINEDVSLVCNIGEAWFASGSALISASSLEKGIALEMVLSIDEGFSNPLYPHETVATLQSPVAHITIVFDTFCADSSCVLYILEGDRKKTSNYRFLAAFNGTQPKRVWSHSIVKQSPAQFMVAFLRSGAISGDDSISDQARIHLINVTNVGHWEGKQGGGASQCIPCPRGSNGDCVPCPPGHYMTAQDHLCIRCPVNTYVNTSSERVGQESCIPCGKNLLSHDGISCKTDGHIHIEQDNRTLTYDLSNWLNRTWTTSGVKVFSREGTSYYHSFNMSLLGGPVRCEEQFEISDTVGVDQTHETVEGAACRMTTLPDSTHNQSRTALFFPVLLAMRLEAISIERQHNAWKLTNQMLEYEGIENSSLPMDIHLWFDTVGQPSEACPIGNTFVITARCQPTRKQPEIRLPHTCPDGTCDGCLFNAIIESAQACPVCKAGDYEKIRGECVQGQQTIHYIPDKHCVLSGKAAKSHNEACSVLSARERTLIGSGIVALLILSLTLIIICRRNRRLEYKYTRLIESRTGELPAAESCGLEEDEDDETTDRVIFSKGKKRLFSGREDKEAFVPLENED